MGRLSPERCLVYIGYTILVNGVYKNVKNGATYKGDQVQKELQCHSKQMNRDLDLCQPLINNWAAIPFSGQIKKKLG